MSNESEPKVGTQEWRDAVVSPLYNTDAWQEFVLSLLKKDEMIDGFPSAPGLMRVARLLFQTVNISTTIHKAPTSTDRSATVTATVNVNNGPEDFVGYFSGSADVYEYNTKSPFNKHPVATAETKAIGRALKMLLNLKIHTHEEMLESENDYKKINERQVKTINLLCDRFEVDKQKFLAAHAGVDVVEFDAGLTNLTESDGINLLSLLNEFQTKGVPPEFTTSSLGTS